MNHFEAVEKMREIAKGKGMTEVDIEILDGIECEGGRNVSGVFRDSSGKQVEIFWDAAFQRFSEQGAKDVL